ncbi:type I Zorya anti-phage system protein ZorA1 [Aeromonas veronii]|uniref:type I Zorya anti-phage system protein ZorA1 n=1 Tax=Aeromonas TaxID=642 RepID=UPI0013188CFA|nr:MULTISPECIES: type I Zorya anti-phage system protein ZorA1 [Aeromonas]MBS4698058.1 anti-phage defense ZorAB system ZorA [Aeromonas allosaccharophila]QHC07825.1 anti-phage defense ZorAB system ZorA [Aeromonas veronii]
MNFTLLFDWLKHLEPSSVPTIVFCLVVLFSAFFCVFYLGPSFLVANKLKQASKGLEIQHELPASEKLEQATAMFAEPKYRAMNHAWKEYADTLHRQSELVEGESRLVAVRATSLSATFFSVPSIVETPLRTEVFKHLPGVLTGLGIVGTFLGLMSGLMHFDVSDPAKVTESVSRLLNDVLFAFVGSSIAIFASIVVTGLEKWRWGRCLQLLEKLTESIDELFKGGVGEEYLADLVKASNESAVNARQLKDSLVSDLRTMMQNLVDTQVQENLKLANTLSTSYQEVGTSLATQIGRSIEDSLKDPLEKIAGSVKQASGDQSGQVQHLLTDVLSAFMSKLDASFGQQFSGLHEMLGQSVTAMQSMQQGFVALVDDMRRAGESSSQQSATVIAQLLTDMQAGQASMQNGMNEMLSKMQAAVERMGSSGEDASERIAHQLERLFAESEARQQQIAEHLNSFIEQSQRSIGQGQEEVMTNMSTNLTQLGSQLNQMFQTFNANQEGMDAQHRLAQADIRNTTETVIGGLDKQLRETLQLVEQQRKEAQEVIDLLGLQTREHLQQMAQGADKMRLAADRFDTAGSSVVQAGETTAKVLGSVQQVGGELAVASRELTTIIGEYRNHRESAAKVLATIESVVAGAQSEQSQRAQLINDLRQHGERMRDLNREATEYLDQIGNALAKGFNEFADGLNRNLVKTMGSLDSELDKAVKGLAGGIVDMKEGIEDLSELFESIKVRR